MIAEDNPAQLRDVSTMVRELRPSWKVVVESGSVQEALDAWSRHPIDMALLDIHMPGPGDPMWLAELTQRVPSVWVTGDVTMGVQAFDLGAIDYVVKPITRRRLKAALDRAAEHLSLKDPNRWGVLPRLGWVSVQCGDVVVIASPDELVYLTSENSQTRAATLRGDGLIDMTLHEIRCRLSPDQFVPTRPGALVNIAHVSHVRRSLMGGYELVINGRAETIKVSRSCHASFRSD